MNLKRALKALPVLAKEYPGYRMEVQSLWQSDWQINLWKPKPTGGWEWSHSETKYPLGLEQAQKQKSVKYASVA